MVVPHAQVSIRKLKDIHTATHPVKMERTVKREEEGADS